MMNEQEFPQIFEDRKEMGQVLHRLLSEEAFRRGESHASLSGAALSSSWLILRAHQQGMWD